MKDSFCAVVSWKAFLCVNEFTEYRMVWLCWLPHPAVTGGVRESINNGNFEDLILISGVNLILQQTSLEVTTL